MLKNKTKKLLVSSVLISFCSSLIVPLTSCSNNGVYFANFESYMSPELMHELKVNYPNLNFRYYGTNEDLERSFERNYDIAIPSTYLMAKLAQQGKLVELNWEKFQLKKSNGEYIKNATDALELFSKTVQNILTKIYDINNDNVINNEDNLLRFGVPYFLQDFIIGYKGNKIDSLHNQNGVQWTNIIDYFGKNTGGKDKQFNKIAMIDDYRSIYSIPRLMQTDKPNTVMEVNPTNGKEKIIPIKEFEETYNILANKFERKDSFLLNSDSGFILNDFADKNGSQAAIMYNGDLIYALQGGDGGYKNIMNTSVGHFIRPMNTLMALDMMVINKKTKNVDEAHQIIKQVGLQGSDGNINELDVNNENYINGPMMNFDYIQYTSPLKNLTNYVMGINESTNTTNIETSYFYENLIDVITDKIELKKFVELLQQIYEVGKYSSNAGATEPKVTNMIEKDLSEINKSNMFYAFNNVRERM